ncbi:alpha-N-arabinofuranosidase [Naasia sp. SYSU D00948]|uniref:arabinosylfuranosidase ArfA n=1 Tax=Naasia sp. SYSU D00948 TaxID=2817379 RepID=UPI001B308515|nr:alpha-N-arabinofuranosidase [Naasia sp. SYSU D00948]
MSSAHVTVNPAFVVGPVRRRLFGSFIEHIGRAVYGGIYEPDHPSADEEGFRQDVLEVAKELDLCGIRYPGGNFVSGYNWEDGVGPKEQRPVRRELAWHSTETNEVGLHEFASWVSKLGTDLMLAINLGTRGTAEAMELLEYTNGPAGSTLADRRVTNGAAEPFGVRTWFLGNEMDGRWQLGNRSADEYGALARRTALAMRQFDPDLELVACGSSHFRMKTFGEWERTVLSHTYEEVDYISCHAYYEEKNGDLRSFLASAANMDEYIEAVIATADHVKALKRSTKTLSISFDEWNVWYLQDGLRSEGFYRSEDILGSDWPVGPRVAEDIYSAADAVVVGSLLISLIKHADRITSACLSMLVNAMAPIRAERGGSVWRQTTFHPFALTSKWARGTALDVRVRCDDYDTEEYGSVPLVHAVATYDEEAGEYAVFVVNRRIDRPLELNLDVQHDGALSVIEAITLSDPDPYAKNTAEDPNRVLPQANDSAQVVDGGVTVTLPPVSWTVIRLAGDAQQPEARRS